MTYHVNGQLIELEKGSGIMLNSYQHHYGFSAEHNEREFIDEYTFWSFQAHRLPGPYTKIPSHIFHRNQYDP